MHPELRLVEDFLTDRGEIDLPPLPRMIFVVRGYVTVAGRAIGSGEVWHGEDRLVATAGAAGATLWRWELSTAPAAKIEQRGVSTRPKLTARLDALPEGDLLWRGDSVAFPPGGCAYLHRHQGPGIRCTIEGELRVDTNGESHSYPVGGAWFEAGPDPVFAQAGDMPTRFIRVMILPRTLLGRSSISYVNEEDRAKPKSQQYKIFVDAPLTRPA